MMKIIKLISLAIIMSGSLNIVHAENSTHPYSDSLAQCMTNATTGKDRKDIVTWFYSILSAHPQISQYSLMSNSERQQIDKKLADIFTRLITEDCLTQAKQTLEHEGREGFRKSFEVLGGIATQEITSNPNVEKSMSNFGEYLDKNKLKRLAE